MKYWRGKSYMIKVGKRRFLLASYNDNRCQSNLQASGSFTLFSRSAKQMKSMIENRFVSVSSEPKWLGSAYVCGDTIIAEVMLGLSGKRVFADVYRTTPQSKMLLQR